MLSVKEALYLQFARIGKAVSSPKRLELLDLLCQGEKTVEALSEASSLGLKNTSAQLKELKAAKLVDFRKKGKFVYHRLADDSVSLFWLALSGLAKQRLSEVQELSREHFASPDLDTEMSRSQVVACAKRGEILLLDIRPEDEFRAGHLPHAVSVPPEDLKRKLPEFPKGKPIVAYCRGPYCLYAKEAVETLRRRGFHASRLEEGVTEWKAAGQELEVEADD